MRRSVFSLLFLAVLLTAACNSSRQSKITIGSKFFTEQVILAELLAQHIEAKTGIPVIRKTNLGGSLLVHKALLAGELDLYVEYTGTALTAVLNESPQGDSSAVYHRVKQLYSERFHLEVTEPLGFENTFAMVIRGDDAQNLHLQKLSDITGTAPKWRAGVGYEFLERPDGFRGWSDRYNLHFAESPKVMDLGLIYRALVDHQVDIVAGNSTDGLIDSLGLVALEDERSPNFPNSAPPSPISPANSPPATYAASTTSSTPSTRTPPPSSAPSANPAASSVRSLFRQMRNMAEIFNFFGF